MLKVVFVVLCEMTRGVVAVGRGHPPFGQANEGCLRLHVVDEWERSQVWALKRVRPCESPDGRQRDSLLRQPVWGGVREEMPGAREARGKVCGTKDP